MDASERAFSAAQDKESAADDAKIPHPQQIKFKGAPQRAFLNWFHLERLQKKTRAAELTGGMHPYYH